MPPYTPGQLIRRVLLVSPAGLPITSTTGGAKELLDVTLYDTSGNPIVFGGGVVDTELPAASALADNMANPTTPLVGASLMGFDGTTWDRVKVIQGSDWSRTLEPDTQQYLPVAALNHQLWPDTGLRSGVSGNGTYFGQIMNDLGDLIISLGSLTTDSGSIQLLAGNGAAGTGSPRVAIGTGHDIAKEATLLLLTALIDNARLRGTLAANNAGTPVDLPIYNATQSVLPVGIGAYPTGANALQTDGNIAHDAVDAGNPGKTGGYASTAAPTAVAAADRVNAWFDLNGRLATFSSHTYGQMSTNTTTTHKSGAGVLHTIVINTKGVATTATVYDNTAGRGTVIAVIDTTLSTTAFLYDVQFSTGLTIVAAGTTAANLTISFR